MWQALMSWASTPVAGYEDLDLDTVELLVAWHEPSAANDQWTYFHPPQGLGQPLLGVSVQRNIARASDPGGVAGGILLDLFLADGPVWATLTGHPDFIGRQTGIPAFEYFREAPGLDELTQTVVIQRAWGQPLVGYAGGRRQRAYRRRSPG